MSNFPFYCTVEYITQRYSFPRTQSAKSSKRRNRKWHSCVAHVPPFNKFKTTTTSVYPVTAADCVKCEGISEYEETQPGGGLIFELKARNAKLANVAAVTGRSRHADMLNCAMACFKDKVLPSAFSYLHPSIHQSIHITSAHLRSAEALSWTR